MKTFNTTGVCIPDRHYMVDLNSRMEQMKAMVDSGKYFTVNRARQYGKTTTLTALARYLENDYAILSLDFQGIGGSGFQSEEKFVKAFCRQLRMKAERAGMPDKIVDEIDEYIRRREGLAALDELFMTFAAWCQSSEKPVVMFIDEVDTAADNQVFLDFLAQLRLQYIERERDLNYRTFQSVILAGVTDVKNLKWKLHPEGMHKFNSPWNIAADFKIDMRLTADGIGGMLAEYELDHHTGMDVSVTAQEIYDYTDGYPFLVSRICQLMDGKFTEGQLFGGSFVWTPEGVGEAVGSILMEKNTLFESLMGKVHDLPELNQMLQRLLFSGEMIPYNPDDAVIDEAEMYGFVKNEQGFVKVANRIFETRLYNFFIKSYEVQCTSLCRAGTEGRSRFVKKGRLDMEGILEWYAVSFHDIYGDRYEVFDEAEGRRRFLLFLKPLINGMGNYYIEAETRSHERMDLVIDYLGERFVIELKIWRGDAYHRRGQRQLAGYLEACHLDRGYLLSYNFNKNKKTGLCRIQIDGRELVEVMV